MSTNEQEMMKTTLGKACFTEALTEVRGNTKNGLDTGEAADGSSDAPREMAMEIATALSSIAAETAGEDTLQPREKNANRKGKRRSDVLATAWALCDWMSGMERAAQQQARKLAQLHRSITRMANKLVTNIAL